MVGDILHTPTAETEMTQMNQTQPPAVQGDEVGESLPSPEEIRAQVKRRHAKSEGESNAAIFFFFGLIFAIALSVGLGVGLGNRQEEEEYRRKSSRETIEIYVTAQGISSMDDFQNPDSPQYRAAHWMAYDDELNMASPDPLVKPGETRHAFEFANRYVMTVFYYATIGENWRFQFRFKTFEPTCNWNGKLLSTRGTPLLYGLICNANGEPTTLILDNNRLTSKIPSEIGLLTSLSVLDLSWNDELHGPLPASICKLTNLDSLVISWTRIRGTIPTCINQLKELRFLSFSNSYLSGEIPSFDGMDKLQTIMLDDNNGLTGDIVSHFNNLPSLRSLILDNNEFRGSLGSNFLKNSQELIQLDLSGNKIGGQLPVHLFGHPDLWLVDLHDNRLYGNLPEFSQGSNVEMLALHKNDIVGIIPASIKNLNKLTHLDLSSMRLSGNITEELGTMTNLIYLFLANNTFQPGPIPDTFAGLVNLEEFSLKATRRTGELPEFISAWTNLKLLDLDGNKFVNKIPSSYGSLTNMEFLLLNDNKLNGVIPDSLKAMTNIRAMFLEYNELEGDLQFMCDTGNFNKLPEDLDGDNILVADCTANIPVACSCCVCCSRGSPVEHDACHDHDLITSLDPVWEAQYKRVHYNFGNDTRFVDRAQLP